jgi:protein-tyrosine phosphatase
MRTSLSHPLRVDALPCHPHAPGVIGITFCPGKRGDSVYGAPWARDLALDLDAIAAWGADMMLTLVEAHELRHLGVPHLGEAVARRGVPWHHLPIRDLQAPDREFMATARDPLRSALTTLRAGGKVLVHCRGGLGRAGTVAASLLIELGERPADALSRVRHARPGSVETAAQESYVLGYTRWVAD